MSESTIRAATTTLKALQRWSQEQGKSVSEATHVSLEYQSPPMVKIGASLRKLKKCKTLSLASNMIERPVMPRLSNLRVLNLSQNNLRTLSGIRFLGNTLEELWVSYNLITCLKPMESMKALKVFYVSYNNIKEWREIRCLNLPNLVELAFMGNPLQLAVGEESFRREVAKRLPNLQKLDFVPIIRERVVENKE